MCEDHFGEFDMDISKQQSQKVKIDITQGGLQKVFIHLIVVGRNVLFFVEFEIDKKLLTVRRNKKSQKGLVEY